MTLLKTALLIVFGLLFLSSSTYAQNLSRTPIQDKTKQLVQPKKMDLVEKEMETEEKKVLELQTQKVVAPTRKISKTNTTIDVTKKKPPTQNEALQSRGQTIEKVSETQITPPARKMTERKVLTETKAIEGYPVLKKRD